MTASPRAATTMASQKASSLSTTCEPDVGTEHVEGAVGEVEDPHDAEGQGEAGSQQKEDERIRQPVEPRDQHLVHTSP